MRIRFLEDYRGKLTAENFYEAGQVGEFEDAAAEQMIAKGVAVQATVLESVKAGFPRLPKAPAKPKGASGGNQTS